MIVLVGLLAQAAAYVRHGNVLLANAPGASKSTSLVPAWGDLMRDLVASICAPGSGRVHPALAGDTPGPDDALSACPICNGTASAYGLPAPELVAAAMAFVSDSIEFPARDVHIARADLIRPQNRGPPRRA